MKHAMVHLRKGFIVHRLVMSKSPQGRMRNSRHKYVILFLQNIGITDSINTLCLYMWKVYIHSLIGIDNYADEMYTEIRNPNQQKCPRGNTTHREFNDVSIIRSPT